MKILACDTSTQVCNVAIQDDTRRFFASEISERNQATLLLPLIQQVLRDAHLRITDIDLLVTNNGPGSFMGLRIALSTLRGLAIACKTPIVTVPTLDAYFYAYQKSARPIIVVIPATKSDIFIGACYRSQHIFKVSNIEKNALNDCFAKIAAHTPIAPLLCGNDLNTLNELKHFIAEKYHPVSTTLLSTPAISLCALGAQQFHAHGADSDSAPLNYVRHTSGESSLLPEK